MSKIAFFTERLPTENDDISLFSWSLIRSLADQHHDIRIYTTNDQHSSSPSHPRIEVVRPFTRWNWWEAAKLLPLLALDAPEIIHVIQPRHESVRIFGPSALNFLSALVSFPTRPRLVISLYEIERKSLNKIAPLLKSAHLILVQNENQKHNLEQNWKIDSKNVRVLSALSLTSSPESEDLSVPQHLQILNENFPKFVFVPGDLGQHKDLKMLFSVLEKLASTDENTAFVIQGSWSDLPVSKRTEWQERFKNNGAAARTLLTGTIDSGAETYLFKASTVTLLATLEPSKLKFWKHSRRSISLRSPLVLSRSQVEADELNWSEIGLPVVADDAQTIAQATLTLLNDPEARNQIRTRLGELADRQVTDLPANHLSRLYLDLLK